jgi:hypothetical protein
MEYALHENFQLEEDIASSASITEFMHDKDARDRLTTGTTWHRQTTMQGLERLHGTPLALTTRTGLEEVPIIHTLWLRHQFKRGIMGSSLAMILSMSLTNVTTFRLEIAPAPLRYFSHWKDLIFQLPHHIRHFPFNIFPRTFLHPIFMNPTAGLPTSLAEKALVEKAHHLVSLCPPAGTNPLNFFQHLRDSQQPEHSSRLAQLCLEVPYDPRGGDSSFQGRINHLLEESAVTARHLPKLEILEIWCHERGKAFVFRYEHDKDQVTITWRASESWINLAEGSIQQWKRVAQKYNVVFSVKELPVLKNAPFCFVGYGDGHIYRKVVYSQLKLRDLVIDPVSLARAEYN